MINFRAAIEEFDRNPPEQIRSLAARFVAGTSPRFLLGRNSEAAILDDMFKVDGFIDDFCPPDTVWRGKPVLRGADLPADAIVVNCVSNSKPRTAHERLVTNGTRAVLGYADFCRTQPGRIPLLPFVEQTRNDLAENAAHWEALYAALCEPVSRQVCDDILRYRLTGDYGVLAGYDYRPWDQYFEDFIGTRLDVFVDAGGYDGDTAEQFSKRYPDYQRIYLFEPDSANLAKARQRLAHTRDIEYVGQGVSDSPGTLNFSTEKGSASAVSADGGVAIPVTTIDTYIKEPVSLIKMDLEGWELNSLKGAQRHIREDRPVLAISAYHHPSDFWRIREFVHSLGLDYDLYMRHYSESWTETVLYFVPRRK
ncbi:MAG: FkbM family methyltransferase [Rhodocyclaceae bacterium]|nr:FkbM family methyltransferase [Rhodocyclaceae bacterium]